MGAKTRGNLGRRRMPRLWENLLFGEWLDAGVLVQGGDGQWQRMPREIYMPPLLGLLWAEVQLLASVSFSCLAWILQNETAKSCV